MNLLSFSHFRAIFLLNKIRAFHGGPPLDELLSDESPSALPTQASHGETSVTPEPGLASHGERRPLKDLILAQAPGFAG